MIAKNRVFRILKAYAEGNEKVANTRHAAAIVYKGEIVAFGKNQEKSHPFQAKFSKNQHAIFLHSEVDVIYKALKKLTLKELAKAELYVIRLRSDGSFGNSCPCKGCQSCITTFGINRVYHS